MLILAFKANNGASQTCTFFQILAYCEVIYCDGGGGFMLDLLSIGNPLQSLQMKGKSFSNDFFCIHYIIWYYVLSATEKAFNL